MNVGIFPVFHQAIDERLILQPFAREEIDWYFTLYGVNASKGDKRVTRLDGETIVASKDTPGVMLEYELAWHDPAIQERGFMETSCYVHLLKNRVHESLDYVGVTQYDMVWTDEAAEIVRTIASATRVGDPIVLGMHVFPFVDAKGAYHRAAYDKQNDYPLLIESYNRFFGRSVDLSALVNRPMCLFQTFLMPRQQFEEMAGWLEVACGEIYERASKPPYAQHWGAMAGRTERAEAVFIAAQLAEKRIKLTSLPVVHDLTIADQLAVAKLH